MFDEATPAANSAPGGGSAGGDSSTSGTVVGGAAAVVSPSTSSTGATTRGRGRVRMQKKNKNSASVTAASNSATAVANGHNSIGDQNSSDNVANNSKKGPRSRGNSDGGLPPDLVHDEAEDGSEVEDAPGVGPAGGSISGLAALLRKVPRRAGLSAFDQELVRLVGQHLQSIGLKTSADVLMAEAGVKLIHPTAANFKRNVLNGEWSRAVKCKREREREKSRLSFFPISFSRLFHKL